MKWENRYLILGASSDLGVELLTELNKREQESLFICHYYEHLESIKNIVPENDNIIKLYQVNFANILEVHDFINNIKEQWGIPTHIVHFSAGKFHFEKLKSFEWEYFCKEMEIQVHSFVEILKACLPYMLKGKQKAKVVIVLSSCTISNPPKYMLSYMMVKYTLMGLMKSLSSDYAGKNICINAISPSMIETKFWQEVDERLVEQNAQKSIGKRNAKVSDIVPSIMFLLSKDSDFIHGINLNISNGNLL